MWASPALDWRPMFPGAALPMALHPLRPQVRNRRDPLRQHVLARQRR